MAFGFKSPVRLRADGQYDLLFTADERYMLRTYLEQLRDLLLGDNDLLRRLFPPAYLDGDDHEREYQELMRGDLIESRFAAIETVEATLDEACVDEATIQRWMQAINSLRLVVGTRLDVSEEPRTPDPEDPDFALYLLYETLGWMLAHIIDAASQALPEPTED